jgi:hypothetical protein
VAIIAIFFSAGVGFAQTISAPLHGYFHPGRAMPVMCNFGAGGEPVVIAQDGAITTQVFGAPNSSAVAPWLVFDSEARGGNLDLRALDDSDVLVADATDDPLLAGSLFPGRRVVTAPLDPVNPIIGPAMAWETLDALLVTPIGLANIPEPKLRELWALGVTIAVSGGAKPAADLPWQNQSGCWIAPAKSPLPAQVNPDVYAPTLQWVGGKSFANRINSVLLAAIFAILLCGICLSYSRAVPLFAAGLTVVFMTFAYWNNQRFSSVSSAQGIVQIDLGRSWNIDDVWTYLRSHRDAQFDLPLSGSVHPIMMETAQWDQANLVLTCASDGSPVALHGRLNADEPIALLTRRLARENSLAGGPVDSPLHLLIAPTLYDNYLIEGQRGPPQWDTQRVRTHFGAVVLQPLN